jgi:hypothetical protein
MERFIVVPDFNQLVCQNNTLLIYIRLHFLRDFLCFILVQNEQK